MKYIIISLLIISLFFLYKYIRRENKSVKVTKNPKKRKIVEKFNTKSYIESTFRQVIHSVKVDDWFRVVSDSSDKVIEFIKKPENGSSRGEVKLIVKYEDIDEFKIKSIYLSAGEFFIYDVNKLTDDDYDFFHNCYVSYAEESNLAAKERVDKSLERIKNVLGRSSIRDSKIDDILGYKD